MQLNKYRPFRSIIQKQTTIGSWITIANPAIAEIMARAGFDWLVLDMEHSAMDISDAEAMIRTIDLCGVNPLVRVTENDSGHIKRAMDSGAYGVIVPMVNSPEEARQAVAAMNYAPKGTRGMGLARAQGYSLDIKEYQEFLAHESALIVQIEHIDAVKRLDDILAVPGVHGFFVGPYDLSASMNIPGEFDHPDFKSAMNTIGKLTHKYLAGFHVVPPNTKMVDQRIGEGFRFVAYSTDFLLLGENCRKDVKTLRASHRGAK